METICQACGYQRRPTDQAPDWQCPTCGKAYVKTSHESSLLPSRPSPLTIYTDHPATEPDARRPGAPSYRRPPKKTPPSKRDMVLVAFFSFFFTFGIPILVDPSSAADVIFHGDAGFVLLLLIIMTPVIVMMRRLSTNIDPNDRKSVFAFAALLIGLVTAVLFFCAAIFLSHEDRIAAKIQRNGLRATADVVRIYSGGCGRHSCSIDVEYAFTPPTEAQAAHGYARLGSRNTDPDVVYARTHPKIPIAYEVGHPEVSALNFNDAVFRIDHGKQEHSDMAMLGKLFLGILALMLAVAGISLWLRPGKPLNTA